MTKLVIRRCSPRGLQFSLPQLVERECARFTGNLFDETGMVSAETWVPRMDLRETEDAYVLEADLPGVKREDIDVSLLNDVVTVRGERKQEQEREADGWHWFERSHGSFERSVQLPRGIDAASVNARLDNGVLKVTIPKAESAKRKQIEVQFN